jgi:hypothetical protein
MCQINFTSATVLASNGTDATSIQVNGTVAACDMVKITFYQNNITQNVIVLVDHSTNPGTWTANLNGIFKCGVLFKIDTICCDSNGNPQTGCTTYTFPITPDCQPPTRCCIQGNVTFVINGCNTSNERLVTFTVNYNAVYQACLPYLLQLDFGDGNFGSAHYINSTGTGTYTDTHNYNASSDTTYNVILTDSLHTGCPLITESVNIISCINNSPCCPQIGNPVITFGNCDNNCNREVIITTPITIGNQANCIPVVVEWDFGGGVTSNAQSFNTAGANSYVVHQYFNPDAASVTATLNIITPANCPSRTIQIQNIPDCNTQMPPCPEILDLTADLGDCDADGKRKVNITAKIKTYGSSCSYPTEFSINYGNGDFNTDAIQGSGVQTLQWTYYYAPSNTPYIIQLLITTPPSCTNKSISITVPDCDIIIDPTTTTKPTLCPCCILLMLLVMSYFILWAFGLYQGDFAITLPSGTVNLGSGLGWASLLYIFLTWLVIQFCFKRVESCKKCWDCRFWKCLFYAALISAVIILILFILSLFGILEVPEWIPSILSAVGVMILASAFMNSDRCKQFFNTGVCG